MFPQILALVALLAFGLVAYFWRPRALPEPPLAIRTRDQLRHAQERLVALEEYRGTPHIDKEIARIQQAIFDRKVD